MGEGAAADRRSSNGSMPANVVQGTDLLEKPYSNNSNGASYQGNGSSYSRQGSAGLRREAAVADALDDAAEIDAQSSQDAETDPCASGHLAECAVSRSMDMEAQEAMSQTSASVNQQQAAVQEATQSPKGKKSGSTWSRVGKYSTVQVLHYVPLPHAFSLLRQHLTVLVSVHAAISVAAIWVNERYLSVRSYCPSTCCTC